MAPRLSDRLFKEINSCSEEDDVDAFEPLNSRVWCNKVLHLRAWFRDCTINEKRLVQQSNMTLQINLCPTVGILAPDRSCNKQLSE